MKDGWFSIWACKSFLHFYKALLGFLPLSSLQQPVLPSEHRDHFMQHVSYSLASVFNSTRYSRCSSIGITPRLSVTISPCRVAALQALARINVRTTTDCSSCTVGSVYSALQIKIILNPLKAGFFPPKESYQGSI